MAEIESKLCKNCQRVFATEADFLTGTSRWRMCDAENLWFNCACGSTLLLMKGKFPWYNPTEGMSGAAASVFNQLKQNKQLPYIKSSILELQEILSQKEVDELEVANSIKKDPLLLSEVMKQAEILRKSRGTEGKELESLPQAVAYLGFQTLSDIITVAALKAVEIDTQVFDPDEFWEESFMTALAAEQISKKFAPYYKSEDVYLAGFLCNIGKLVTAFYFPEQIDQVAEDFASPKTKGGWLKAEQSHGMADHRVLGEIACTMWGLPAAVLEAAMRHHDAKFEKAQKFPVREIIAFANQMTHWARLNPSRIDEVQLKLIVERFKLSDGKLDEFAAELSDILNKAKDK